MDYQNLPNTFGVGHGSSYPHFANIFQFHKFTSYLRYFVPVPVDKLLYQSIWTKILLIMDRVIMMAVSLITLVIICCPRSAACGTAVLSAEAVAAKVSAERISPLHLKGLLGSCCCPTAVRAILQQQ